MESQITPGRFATSSELRRMMQGGTQGEAVNARPFTMVRKLYITLSNCLTVEKSVAFKAHGNRSDWVPEIWKKYACLLFNVSIFNLFN